MGDMILYRSSSGGTGSSLGYPVGNVTNFKAIPSDKSITISWNDPSDITTNAVVVKWKSTRIVRKIGSKPTSEIDGTIVVESTVRNQYSSIGFKDTGLTEGTTYYYAAFTCSDYGVYSKDPEYVQATTIHYRVMTVVIDESDSNPETCCVYQNDAIGKYYGFNQNAIDEWKEFFKYRPCVMEYGKVIQYLDVNDYSKQEDETASRVQDEISSDKLFNTNNPLWNGNYSTFDDVMVEIPRMGVSLKKTGTKITVSITDNPNASGYSYSAFRFKEKDYDKLYISAYAVSKMTVGNDNIQICSSPYTSLGAVTFDDDIDYDSRGGYGPIIGELDLENGKSTVMGYMSSDKKGIDTYHITTWQQWILIQCMTILQTKSLNLQKSYDNADLGSWGDGYTVLKEKSISGGPFWYTSNGDRGIVTLFGIRDLLSIGELNHNNEPLTTSFDNIIYYDNICMTKDGTLYVSDNGKYIEDHRNLAAYKNTNVKLLNPDDLSGGSGTTRDHYITQESVHTDLGFIPTKLNFDAAQPGSSTTYYCDGAGWHYWNDYTTDKIYFITNGCLGYSSTDEQNRTLQEDGLFTLFVYRGDPPSHQYDTGDLNNARIHVSVLI